MEEEEKSLFYVAKGNDDKNMTHKQVNAHVFSRYIYSRKTTIGF